MPKRLALAPVRVSEGIGHNRTRAPLSEAGGYMAAIAFTDAHLAQIKMTATQIPRRLRDAYLQRVVQLLNGRDFGDGDVHRAARAAAGEIMHGPRPMLAGRDAVASNDPERGTQEQINGS